MAYYDALIAAWNNATQPPPGVTGNPLTVGMTTQQKCDTINQWTVLGSVTGVIVPTWRIYDAIVLTEYDATSATNQTIVNNILAMGNVNCASGSNARRRLLAIYPNTTTSNGNLLSLFNSIYTPVQDWCFTNAYPSNGPSGLGAISVIDAQKAGLV